MACDRRSHSLSAQNLFGTCLGFKESPLEESGGVNFWEVGWLRHRIAWAKAALQEIA